MSRRQNGSGFETSGRDEFQIQRRPVVVRLDSVSARPVEWLWQGWLARGKFHLIEGWPGLGKTTLVIDLMARLTTGQPFPGETARRAPVSVGLLTAEDDLGDTIRPRLDAAGGDASRVIAISGIVDRGCVDPSGMNDSVRLPLDISALHEAITDNEIALLFFDPLVAFLGSEIDSYVDAQVRRAVRPLAELGQETGCAMLGNRHWTKRNGGGNAVTAGGGSIGFIGAARACWLVAHDPDSPEQRVLASVKCNLARRPPSLRFGLQVASNNVTRIAWGGEDSRGADDLYDAVRARAEDPNGSATDEAADLLHGWLSPLPRSRKEVLKLGRDAGLSESTIERAARKLRVTRRSTGFGTDKTSMWSLNSVNSAKLHARGDSDRN